MSQVIQSESTVSRIGRPRPTDCRFSGYREHQPWRTRRVCRIRGQAAWRIWALSIRARRACRWEARRLDGGSRSARPLQFA